MDFSNMETRELLEYFAYPNNQPNNEIASPVRSEDLNYFLLERTGLGVQSQPEPPVVTERDWLNGGSVHQPGPSRNGTLTSSAGRTLANLDSAIASASSSHPGPSGSAQPCVATPYVEIIEQPVPGLKYRYKDSENRAAAINGMYSTAENKTWPTIKIHNHIGPALVVVSCVTNQAPHRVHPHNLVFHKDDNNGGVIQVNKVIKSNNNVVKLNKLKIMCIKMADVELAIQQREVLSKQVLGVDPFHQGFNYTIERRSIDLNSVRLAFQVYVRQNKNERWQELAPVVSEPISKIPTTSGTVLDIKFNSCDCGPMTGGSVILLVLSETVNLDSTIEVQFLERCETRVVWSGLATIEWKHKGLVLKIRSPAYSGPNSAQREVDVWIQLVKRSNETISRGMPFTYFRDDGSPPFNVEVRNPRVRRDTEDYLPVHRCSARPSAIRELHTSDEDLGDLLSNLSLKF